MYDPSAMPRFVISGLLWVAAILVTIALAMFQRVTGPSYPKSGSSKIGAETIPYELLRSYDTGSDLPVRVETGPDIRGSAGRASTMTPSRQ